MTDMMYNHFIEESGLNSSPVRGHSWDSDTDQDPRSSPNLRSDDVLDDLPPTSLSSLHQTKGYAHLALLAQTSLPNNNTMDKDDKEGDNVRRGRPRLDDINHLIKEAGASRSVIRCPHCRRVFPREKSLQAHVRTHTGERPYVCTFTGCDKRFAQSGQLRTHQRLHTGEKPFACAAFGCEMRFTHANRHCPNHPNAGLKRKPKFEDNMKEQESDSDPKVEQQSSNQSVSTSSNLGPMGLLQGNVLRVNRNRGNIPLITPSSMASFSMSECSSSFASPSPVMAGKLPVTPSSSLSIRMIPPKCGSLTSDNQELSPQPLIPEGAVCKKKKAALELQSRLQCGGVTITPTMRSETPPATVPSSSSLSFHPIIPHTSTPKSRISPLKRNLVVRSSVTPSAHATMNKRIKVKASTWRAPISTEMDPFLSKPVVPASPIAPVPTTPTTWKQPTARSLFSVDNKFIMHQKVSPSGQKYTVLQSISVPSLPMQVPSSQHNPMNEGNMKVVVPTMTSMESAIEDSGPPTPASSPLPSCSANDGRVSTMKGALTLLQLAGVEITLQEVIRQNELCQMQLSESQIGSIFSDFE